MKLISWNCNGLRSVLAKGVLQELVEAERPDVLLLQETRVQVEPDGMDGFEGWHRAWNPAVRPGYSGTAVLSRLPIEDARVGAGRDRRDPEARVLTVDLPGLTVVSAYGVNARRDLSRLPERVRFDAALTRHLRTRTRRRPVVLGGDLNVAPTEIDVTHPENKKNHVCYHEDVRKAFWSLCSLGLVDVFRKHRPGEGEYSFWDYRVPNSLERNIGWRIDHILATAPLAERSIDSYADREPRAWEKPSDHTVVVAEFRL